MSNKSNQQKAQESSRIYTNVDEMKADSKKLNSQLIKREKIPNSPFYAIGSDELGYFISIGAYRLTEPQKTLEEAKDLLNTHQWQIMASLIVTMYQAMKKEDEDVLLKKAIRAEQSQELPLNSGENTTP